MTHKFPYSPKQNFPQLLNDLESNQPAAWNWLVTKFRKKLSLYFKTEITNYPTSALLTKAQFIEELMEKTLIEFFQIFPNTTFQQYAELEQRAILIARKKLEAQLLTLKKEQAMYHQHSSTATYLRQQLQQLPSLEKTILVRYFSGEHLDKIADDLKMNLTVLSQRKTQVLGMLMGEG